MLENEHCLFLQKPEPDLTGSGLVVPRAEAVFDLSPAEWQAPYLRPAQTGEGPLDVKHASGGHTIGWNCEDAGGRRPSRPHAIPRFAEEPLAGKGLRFHLQQPANERAQPEE
ncbi:MAG: HIT family protein [Bacteroidetes bacterium QS_9_68_14]|nr:MAG: HIT family protein [Bacteroidetes bacterium QS_9_68_14]